MTLEDYFAQGLNTQTGDNNGVPQTSGGAGNAFDGLLSNIGGNIASFGATYLQIAELQALAKKNNGAYTLESNPNNGYGAYSVAPTTQYGSAGPNSIWTSTSALWLTAGAIVIFAAVLLKK